MSLAIPASVNYPSPLVAVPSYMQDEPNEGRKQVPCEILWGSMGGTLKCVSFNLQNNATLNISQISTLKVDNSASGADVVFIFPDTSDTVTVPGGAPYVLVPVFSNATQFFVSAPTALSGDVTRFQILNYQTEPVDVPAGVEAQPANSSGVVLDGSGPVTTQLIPASVVTGTLETILLGITPNVALGANSKSTFTVQDGNGNNFINAWSFFIFSATPPTPSNTIINIPSANWRFQNGLKVIFTPVSGWTTGSLNGNYFANYKTP